MMLNKTNVKQANLQMMWLSSSHNSCLNFFLTERFVFLNGVFFFFSSLVFNIELVIPIWGQMNHHFNFLYIFFFMLIIVLKDKCDFNIHAYWFIFSSHIWKNSKEILFFMPFHFSFCMKSQTGEDKFCWQNDFVGCVVEFCFWNEKMLFSMPESAVTCTLY